MEIESKKSNDINDSDIQEHCIDVLGVILLDNKLDAEIYATMTKKYPHLRSVKYIANAVVKSRDENMNIGNILQEILVICNNNPDIINIQFKYNKCIINYSKIRSEAKKDIFIELEEYISQYKLICNSLEFERTYVSQQICVANLEIAYQILMENNSFDEVTSNIREGNFNILPLQKEYVKYIEKAFNFIKSSKEHFDWLSNAVNFYEDCPKKLSETIECDDRKYTYFIYENVQYIIRKGWSNWVRNLFIDHGIGMNS